MLAIPNNELSPHYYRDNFLRLCATVQARYGDLMDNDTTAFLGDFHGLGFDAQCLYIRLASRTSPWFRESRLDYPELGDQAAALDELLQHGLAQEATGLSTAELNTLYTHAELTRAFASLSLPRASAKGALLAALEANYPDAGQRLLPLRDLDDARIVAPVAVDRVALLQLLFFGNRHQGLKDFVLQDLGVARYYPYPLERDQRLFECREALGEYLDCACLQDEFRQYQEAGEAEELRALAARLQSLTLHFDTTRPRWQRLCNAMAREFERGQDWQLAAALYKRSERHPARERRARILERNSDWPAASALCHEILADPWCEEEQEAAARILPRLQRKLGETPAPRRRDQFEQLSLQLPRTASGVEHCAAEALRGQWPRVHYVENRLMNTLFGLAFWDQIFSGVPGAFHHPYQSVPADMYQPDFYARRRAAIDRRLAQLRDGDMEAALTAAWRRYQGYQCRWVDWRHVDEELVAAAARTMPKGHLLAIWRRILFDPGENRRGFPDLVALGEATGDYRLIEVKAPGDRLQDSQKRWLRFFQGQGIPAAVALVSWRD